MSNHPFPSLNRNGQPDIPESPDNNPILINPYQPERPRVDEEGNGLLFRTRPKWGKQMFAIHTVANQACALTLYRAVRAGEVPRQTAIADLFNWIASDLFNKRNLGSVVVNSVMYEPRVLLNRKDIGAMMTYNFRDLRELEYGLEWIICIILRKLMDDIQTPVEMAEELNMLAAASESEFQDVYISGLGEMFMAPIDWMEHSMTYRWGFRENIPKTQIRRQEIERPAPTPPRDLSRF